jgi:RNA recognition motif-containing protein
MGKKLYVGSLPYSVTDQQLAELFSAHGAVDSARVIVDRVSGQSKGFGFVEMGSDDDAAKAITALNGTQFQGRRIIVNEARPQEPRSGGPRGPGNRGGYARQ